MCAYYRPILRAGGTPSRGRARTRQPLRATSRRDLGHGTSRGGALDRSRVSGLGRTHGAASSSSNNTTNGPSPNAATSQRRPWHASARPPRSRSPHPSASASPAERSTITTSSRDHFSTTRRGVIRRFGGRHRSPTPRGKVGPYASPTSVRGTPRPRPLTPHRHPDKARRSWGRRLTRLVSGWSLEPLTPAHAVPVCACS